MVDVKNSAENRALLEQIAEGGLSALFDDAEICGYLKEGLKEAGCRPPFHIVIFAVLKKAALLGWDFGGEALRSRLLALLAGNERLTRLLDGVANLCRSCEDRNRLKDMMIAHLRGETYDGTPPRIDDATDEEVLRQLYTTQRFDAHDERLAAVAETLQDLLAEGSADAIAPLLGWVEGGTATLADSIRYNSGLYDFTGREPELDLLSRFCGDISLAVPGNRFSWLLLTGPGGEGKTRLALEFTTKRIERNWRGGRLSLPALKGFRHGEWFPAQPTFIVIDYPAQEPEEVHALLANLARRHRAFDWPVRVLLLEREANGEWLECIVPDTGDGGAIRALAYVQDGQAMQEGVQITPLAPEAVAALMQGRFRKASLEAPEVSLLLSAASKADSRSKARSPRPLFAAAVAEVMIAGLQGGETIDENWISALASQNVLSSIINRDRSEHWRIRAGGDPQVLELHENLVAFATLAGGVCRADLHVLPASVAALLPDLALKAAHPLREELVQRMGGYEKETGRIAPLEPDLLGEHFLLSRLTRIQEVAGQEARRALCLSAFELNADTAEEVAFRTAVDFPDGAEQLEWLFPGGDASRCPGLATTLDGHLRFAGDHLRRERLHSRLAADGAFARSLTRCGVHVIAHWMRMPEFADQVGDALRAAVKSGNYEFASLPISQVVGLLELCSGQQFDEVRTAAWDEIAQRSEAEPEYFDSISITLKSSLIRHAVEDGRGNLTAALSAVLLRFLAREDHAGPDDLGSLSHLSGLGGELQHLSIAAAKAVAKMVESGRFPLCGISFKQVIDANSMMKQHGFTAGSDKLKLDIDGLEDDALLLSACELSSQHLSHVYYEFASCCNFIERLDALVESTLPEMFMQYLNMNIAQLAIFHSMARRRHPEWKERIDALVEENAQEVVSRIRGAPLSVVSQAVRISFSRLRDLLLDTLDDQEWNRRQPLAEKSMNWAPVMAFILVRQGADAFGGELARCLARRADQRDLQLPPWERSRTGQDRGSRVVAKIWQVAATCPDEELARAYLGKMKRHLLRACLFDSFASLADSLAEIWTIDRQLLEWIDWQSTLMGRIRRHLLGNDAPDAEGDESDFIRLLGALSVRFGSEPVDKYLPPYLDRIGSPHLFPNALLHSADQPTHVQRHQMQYWLGLRCLDSVDGIGLIIDRTDLTAAIDLLRVNLTENTDPFILSLDRDLIEWLEGKLMDSP